MTSLHETLLQPRIMIRNDLQITWVKMCLAHNLWIGGMRRGRQNTRTYGWCVTNQNGPWRLHLMSRWAGMDHLALGHRDGISSGILKHPHKCCLLWPVQNLGRWVLDMKLICLNVSWAELLFMSTQVQNHQARCHQSDSVLYKCMNHFHINIRHKTYLWQLLNLLFCLNN